MNDTYSLGITDHPGQTSKDRRNQILSDLLFLVDHNYQQFEMELHQGRAWFDTFADLGILGLGAAGTLHPSAGTKAILAAISGGLGGTRVSIDKNFFHEKSSMALIATMRAHRSSVLLGIRQGMQLDQSQYPLATGLSDVVRYYNAGTLVGALENIIAEAGEVKSRSEEGLQRIIHSRYQASEQQMRGRIRNWIDASEANTEVLHKKLSETLPADRSREPAIWVESAPPEELRAIINLLNIPEE